MRINKLEFSAVGPYANHQVIDFDVLGGSALYLIDGPTGAGKSTIIDCIVYALYNEMAGDASDPTRIRSQFAQPTQETWVELTFTTNSGSYKVRRSPAFKRLKKNGQGTTDEKPTATLWKLDSQGEVAETIETHVREVGTMLSESIIGLSKSQFVQTVVLPQGEFAKFLRAETKDREELLEKVFGTGLYKKVSELLDLKAKAAQGDRKLITDEIISLLDQYQTMVGYSDEQVVALKKLVTSGLDKDFLEEIEEAFKSFEEEHSVVKAEYDKALALLDSAKNVLKQREAESLAVSHKADAESTLQQTIVEVESSLNDLADFEPLLKSLGIATAADQKSSQWEIHTQIASTERGAMQALLEVEKRVEKWPAVADQLQAIIAGAKESIGKVDETLQAIPVSIEKLSSTVSMLTSLRIDLHAAQEQLASLLAQKDLMADLTRLKQDKAAADQKLVEATKKALAAVETVTDLREKRIRGIAGELAASLTDGQPCVVCGSTQHPSPAQPDDDAVTVDMIEEAEGLAKIAEKAQETAKKTVDELVVEIAQIEVQLTVDVTKFDSVKAELEKSVSEINSKITTALAAESEIESLNTQRIELTRERGELQTSLSTTEQKLADGNVAYDEDLKKLSASLGGYESIQEKFDAIDSLVSRLSAVTHCVGARERAQQDLNEADAALSALAKSEDFAKVEAAQNKERELNSNALAIKTRFDVLANKLKDATNQVKSIRAKIDQRTKQAGSTQDLENLAKTFAKNSNGQSLNIYVLQSIFENVLSVANRSFESLLEGRYRLVSSDESDGHAAKRRGLGVNVEDIYTGAQRAAKTLSGGETFCASLALALGMAGVVRANAGGVSIDTLFIDEGFGSLDGDRLGDVMNMLQGIKNSGRTIGVISHVDEMKTQIAERIVVIPGGKDKPTTMEVTWM